MSRFLVLLLLISACVLAGGLARAADGAGAASETEASPVIASVSPEGKPVVPFESTGDLWFNTWADDGNLYCSWGDGKGPNLSTDTDCGIARLAGTLPNITGEVRCDKVPKTVQDRTDNEKPSSLLYLDGNLVGAFHSPLGQARIGYLAVSRDRGATWRRIGFNREGQPVPADGSPWTSARKSNFRCLFFINMGQAYGLNTDGYVYALGIGTEWGWFSKQVYLCRVPRKEILNYTAYTYFAGMKEGSPVWSPAQEMAQPVPGLQARDQGSAMFHPQLGRYLFLTRSQVFDAPAPWGPWTVAGTWNDWDNNKPNSDWPVEWQGGYQPGIVSKDTGPDWFWFNIAGQAKAPRITYNLHLGKMRLLLRPHDGVSVTRDPVSQTVAAGTKVTLSIAMAGKGPITCRWLKDGKPVAGADQPMLVLDSAKAADAGGYYCAVSNALGCAYSGTAKIKVTGGSSK